MFTSTQLRQQLASMNRKSYPAYKSLKGAYRFPDYLLSVDHVQGDPFASPSHVSVYVSRKKGAKHKHMLLCQVLKRRGRGRP